MNPDYQEYCAVRRVLERYVEGAASQDAELLEGLFHPEARMYGYLDGVSRIVPIADFVARVRAAPAAPIVGYQAEIASIEVRLNAASATLLERNYNGRDFVDLFHLLKTGDEWRIVAKTFAHF